MGLFYTELYYCKHIRKFIEMQNQRRVRTNESFKTSGDVTHFDEMLCLYSLFSCSYGNTAVYIHVHVHVD